MTRQSESPKNIEYSDTEDEPTPRDVTVSPRDVTVSPRDVTVSPRDVTMTPRDVTVSADITNGNNKDITNGKELNNIETNSHFKQFKKDDGKNNFDEENDFSKINNTTPHVAMTTHDIALATHDNHAYSDEENNTIPLPFNYNLRSTGSTPAADKEYYKPNIYLAATAPDEDELPETVGEESEKAEDEDPEVLKSNPVTEEEEETQSEEVEGEKQDPENEGEYNQDPENKGEYKDPEEETVKIFRTLFFVFLSLFVLATAVGIGVVFTLDPTIAPKAQDSLQTLWERVWEYLDQFLTNCQNYIAKWREEVSDVESHHESHPPPPLQPPKEPEIIETPEQRKQNIASLIADSALMSKITTTTDLTEAEELVKGLTFEKYNEDASSQVMIGIKLSDFKMIVEQLATAYQIPEDKKVVILMGEFAGQYDLKQLEFTFNVGASSVLTYCKVATIKTSDTMVDLALMMYKLDFQLARRKIETIEETYFLSVFPTGSSKNIHFEDRNLSEMDKQKMRNFFRVKALRGFIEDNPSTARVSYD